MYLPRVAHLTRHPLCSISRDFHVCLACLGVRGNFVGATRIADYGSTDRTGRKCSAFGGGIDGHFDHILAADSEHGDGSRPFSESNEKREWMILVLSSRLIGYTPARYRRTWSSVEPLYVELMNARTTARVTDGSIAKKTMQEVILKTPRLHSGTVRAFWKTGHLNCIYRKKISAVPVPHISSQSSARHGHRPQSRRQSRRVVRPDQQTTCTTIAIRFMGSSPVLTGGALRNGRDVEAKNSASMLWEHIVFSHVTTNSCKRHVSVSIIISSR